MNDPREWRQRLLEHVERTRTIEPLPDGHMLGPLHDWQRRITGGSLLEFFEWVTSEEAFERYPILEKDPITERIFVCVTDMPGAVAFREIVDQDNELVACALREEWRAFLEDPSQPHDDELELHYEFWSAWHRRLDTRWELPEDSYHQLWVHEEGFAVADGAGRGSQHVWHWDGQAFELIAQDITRWVD